MATASHNIDKSSDDDSYFMSEEFVGRSMSFLARYQWIYDFALTDFLHDRLWEKIPHDWIDSLCSCTLDELNTIPYGFFKDDWPASLCEFIQEAETLCLQRIPDVEKLQPVTLAQESKRGMKPKKIHEVSFMSTLVDDVCQETMCSNIVDVGAGLGYLSHTLHQQCGYRVLALECEESRTHSADNRASKLDLTGIDSATFHLESTPESFYAFQELIASTFIKTTPVQSVTHSNDTHPSQSCHVINDCNIIDSNRSSPQTNKTPSEAGFGAEESRRDSLNVCMIGLHCCGPLTPAMLELFLNCDSIKSAVLVSCCYHSMPVDDTGECSLFPLSSRFKQVYSKTKESFNNWKIGKFALRLAAQETRARWKSQSQQDHDYHTKNVAYRAILEIFSKHNKTLMKQKRRLAHKKDYNDFDTYLDAIFTRTSMDAAHRKDLGSIHDEHEQYFKFVELFTALQVLLQPVLETLIYADRLAYLRQCGVLDSRIVPIFDESISPRNLAIVACKSTVS